MNTDLEFLEIANKIKRDAPSWGIDFADPANQFTVWFYAPDRMRFCGSFTTHNEACAHASELPQSEFLYIALGSLNVVSVMKFIRE